MELTRKHIEAAREAGACSKSLRRLWPGMRVEDLTQDECIWVEDRAPDLAAEWTGELPLWAAIRSGYGYGYGSGSGYGDGDGYGSGYGSGYGDGYGSGYGDGDGDGDGSGYGYGYAGVVGGKPAEWDGAP